MKRIQFQQKHPWVLASGSPRRKEYLERYGFSFRIQKASIVEIQHEGEKPLDFVLRMAQEKGIEVQKECAADELVISADTIVTFDDEILGKPVDKDDALKMLKALNNRTHEVITGFRFAIAELGIEETISCTTKVHFKPLPEVFLKAYAASTDPMDKAGAYSIQGEGTFLVDSIEGSYNNVVGFPIEMFLENAFQKQLIDVLPTN